MVRGVEPYQVVQFALHLGGVGVDEDGALFVAQLRQRQHHPRGVLRARRGDNRSQRAFRVGVPGRRDLFRERARPVADLLHPELVAVDELVELRGEGVGQPGQRGHEQEGGDEYPCVEVQSDEQGSYAPPRRTWLRGAGFRGG